MATRKIHILGGGSLGLLLASLASTSSSRFVPTLILRQPSYIKFLNRGARLTYYPHGENFESNDRIVASEMVTDTSQIDVLFLATKAHHAINALESIQHRLTPLSVIFLFQNGLMGLLREMSSRKLAISKSQVVLGSVTHGSWRKDEFSVVHAGAGDISFGLDQSGSILPDALERSERQQTEDVLRNVISDVPDLNSTQFSYDDMQRILWKKLVANCCINPLTGLSNRKNGLLNNSSDFQTMSQIISEVIPLLPHDLFPDQPHKILLTHVLDIIRLTANNRSSMLQDMANHQQTEIEYLNGYIVKLAAERGIPAPLNQSLKKQVQANKILKT